MRSPRRSARPLLRVLVSSWAARPGQEPSSAPRIGLNVRRPCRLRSSAWLLHRLSFRGCVSSVMPVLSRPTSLPRWQSSAPSRHLELSTPQVRPEGWHSAWGTPRERAVYARDVRSPRVLAPVPWYASRIAQRTEGRWWDLCHRSAGRSASRSTGATRTYPGDLAARGHYLLRPDAVPAALWRALCAARGRRDALQSTVIRAVRELPMRVVIAAFSAWVRSAVSMRLCSR